MDERITLTVVILCVLFSVGKAQLECDTLPTDSIIRSNLETLIASQGGEDPDPNPNLLTSIYSCMAQGMTMGSYREVSVIVTYDNVGNSPGLQQSGQFDLVCVPGGGGGSDNGWQGLSGSLLSAPSGFETLETRTNCSQCRVSANNDHDCVGKGLSNILPI